MSRIATAAALSFLLLAACGGREGEPVQNGSVAAESNALESSRPSDPGRPAAPVDGSAEPVPPPDAVSHPDGYLPPAPADPAPASGNTSGPEGSPTRATEDEYLRNGQSGR